MTKKSGQDDAPSIGGPDAAEEQQTVGPTGLTYREKQRRRIVIAGLTAPTLMSLPSRRAWSVACSKSKMKKISGNLSAKKQVMANCDAIGCKHNFWDNSNNWPVVAGGPSPGDDFSMTFVDALMLPRMYKGPDEGKAFPTLLDVLQGKGDILDKVQINGVDTDTVYEPLNSGKIKDLNRAMVASWLNAFYLNNMGFMISFTVPATMPGSPPPGTTQQDVKDLYYNFISMAIATASDGQLDAGKSTFEAANDQNCPL